VQAGKNVFTLVRLNMDLEKKRYFENLDALRFVSFFFIFFGHALDTDSELLKQDETYFWVKHYIYIFGKTGFSFAFVLSSYINTWVILEERKNSGNFRPLMYYMRRALRIWPLYFLTLLIGFVLVPVAKDLLNEPFEETANPLYFIFFVGNFYLIEHGFSQSPIISVLWSVSVEEQFYIFWPFLLLIGRFRIKWLFPLLIIVFIISTFYLFGVSENGQFILWYHTLFLLGDIAMGALFAFISHPSPALPIREGTNFSPIYNYLQNLSKTQIAVAYILFWICLIFYKPIFENNMLPGAINLIIEKITFAVLLAFFIFEQNFCKNSWIKFGRLKLFSFLGLISYGLFCFHEIGILIGGRVLELFNLQDSVGWFLLIKPAVALIIIIPAAYFSYYYFEIKFLKLKKYFYS